MTPIYHWKNIFLSYWKQREECFSLLALKGQHVSVASENKIITELVEIGWGFWRASCPRACSKQVAQACVQDGCEYLQRWRLHGFSEHFVRVFNNSQTKRLFFFFFMFRCKGQVRVSPLEVAEDNTLSKILMFWLTEEEVMG